jgi:hypothetical protein
MPDLIRHPGPTKLLSCRTRSGIQARDRFRAEVDQSPAWMAGQARNDNELLSPRA